MKKIIKGICLLLVMVLFVGLVSCDKTVSQGTKVIIYGYDGENYTVSEEKEVKRYSEYSFPEYDEVNRSGYTFLGWINLTKDVKTLKELEEKFASKSNCELKPSIEGKANTSVYYYPVLIKNDNLESFLATSPIAKVEITLISVLNGKEDTKSNYLAKLLDTYDISFDLVDDIDGYEFLGYSLTKLKLEEYEIDGLSDDVKLDLNSQVEKHSKITIYAYYRSVK